MTFHILGMFIIPTDELIFFRGVGIPPTSYPSCISTWVLSYHRHHICVNTVGYQAPTGWSSTRWLRLALQPLEARRNKVARGSSAHSYHEDFLGAEGKLRRNPWN